MSDEEKQELRARLESIIERNRHRDAAPDVAELARLVLMLMGGDDADD